MPSAEFSFNPPTAAVGTTGLARIIPAQDCSPDWRIQRRTSSSPLSEEEITRRAHQATHARRGRRREMLLAVESKQGNSIKTGKGWGPRVLRIKAARTNDSAARQLWLARLSISF